MTDVSNRPLFPLLAAVHERLERRQFMDRVLAREFCGVHGNRLNPQGDCPACVMAAYPEYCERCNHERCVCEYSLDHPERTDTE